MIDILRHYYTIRHKNLFSKNFCSICFYTQIYCRSQLWGAFLFIFVIWKKIYFFLMIGVIFFSSNNHSNQIWPGLFPFTLPKKPKSLNFGKFQCSRHTWYFYSCFSSLCLHKKAKRTDVDKHFQGICFLENLRSFAVLTFCDSNYKYYFQSHKFGLFL